MKQISRKAMASWKCGVKGDTGTVTTQGGIFKNAQFSLGGKHRNTVYIASAELLAAAHASSFSLALSKELGAKSMSLGEIVTTSTVLLEQLGTGWKIKTLQLNVVASLPKVTQSKFIDATVRAKTNCLVCGLLHVTVSMNAKLEPTTGVKF